MFRLLFFFFQIEMLEIEQNFETWRRQDVHNARGAVRICSRVTRTLKHDRSLHAVQYLRDITVCWFQ